MPCVRGKQPTANTPDIGIFSRIHGYGKPVVNIEHLSKLRCGSTCTTMLAPMWMCTEKDNDVMTDENENKQTNTYDPYTNQHSGSSILVVRSLRTGARPFVELQAKMGDRSEDYRRSRHNSDYIYILPQLINHRTLCHSGKGTGRHSERSRCFVTRASRALGVQIACVCAIDPVRPAACACTLSKRAPIHAPSWTSSAWNEGTHGPAAALRVAYLVALARGSSRLHHCARPPGLRRFAVSTRGRL